MIYLFAVFLYLGPFLAVSALWAADMISGRWFIFAGIWFVCWVMWAVTSKDEKK